MIKELETKIGINFNDKNLLKTALTHSSYTNENEVDNNERLEFLGDAVMELLISQYLYNNYQDLKEGDLTKKRAQLVCEEALNNYANSIDLGKYLILGKGEEKSGGRTQKAILADAFEALLGAIYLDQGYDKANCFILDFVIPHIEETSKIKDYKSYLQELVQSDKRNIVYDIIDDKGPAHKKVFTAVVKMDNIVLGQGTGRTKKEAEQNSAKKALEKLAKIDDII